MEKMSAVEVAGLFSVQIDEDFPQDDEILIAEYTEGDWCGDAFVLFVKHGKLYEVHCSHCSCYGCEEQWEPEETTLAALKMRPSGIWEGIKDHPLVQGME